MTLQPARFAEFFRLVNGGREPFGWQTRLFTSLVETGRWPDIIAVPTGGGKSSVVDIHVFAVALSACGSGPRVPRRMAVVVNRRALVDKHYARAQELRELLNNGNGMLHEVAEALRSLTGGTETLLCTSLRGGQPTDNEWISDPRLPAVISATPDMWGSRVLFRGYGTRRNARARDAGVLALDSVMVLDEAHLNRQLLHTAKNLSALIDANRGELGDVPGLQVVATTATPSDAQVSDTVVRVAENDLMEPLLAPRLTKPKRVRLVRLPSMPSKMPPSAKYVSEVAAQAVEVADQAPRLPGTASTVLCVMNNVETAVRLASELVSIVGDEHVECWVGRMRPMDLDKLRRARPSLFTIRGDDEVKFLVSTQTVEVGVDLDAVGLVTELAPGSALTQRFGRVNRIGLRDEAQIRVIAPVSEVQGDRLPYRETDLADALKWLDSLGPDGEVNPLSLSRSPAPEESLPRMLLSDLYPEHGQLLAQTSEDFFEEPELAFWLRDDLEGSPEPVGVVARGPLPKDENLAMALLEATPVDDREIFPTTLGIARTMVDRILEDAEDSRIFCWRAGELVQVSNDTFRIRPGDQLVVEPVHSLTLRGVVVAEPPAKPEHLRTVWGELSQNGEELVRVVSEDSGDPLGLLSSLAGLEPEAAQRRFAELSGGDDQVILAPDDQDPLPWIVIKKLESIASDAEARQEWSQVGEVSLEQHQSAVATRAARMASDVGLGPDTITAMTLAGLHHDDGKADPHFQRDVLMAIPGGPLLAKSGARSLQQSQRNHRRSRARAGWRHEQLSAAMVWAELEPGPVRDLVARLAGTSHGRGRPFFPVGEAGLLTGGEERAVVEAASGLFGTGSGWSEVLERTDVRFGVWGVAYLEAVLRAADCQVSKEGS